MVYRSPSMALRDLRSLTLAVHVASGAVALLASVIAASIAKGPGAHARVGRVYAVAMLLVAATAVILWALGASTFLLLVALFSAQLVATGWRLARHRAGTPGAIDRALAAWSLLTAAGMLGFGVLRAATGGGAAALVPLTFGALSLNFARSDLRRLRAPPTRGRARVRLHLARMLGATIGTFTAVLVVNGHRLHLPPLAAWLGPTVVLVPLIAAWSRRYGDPARAVVAPE